MRRALPVVLLIGSSPLLAETASLADIDHLEQLSWSDSQAALRRLDQLQPTVQSDKLLVQLLAVRGMALVDTDQVEAAQELIARLRAMGARDLTAEASAHIVQAYLLHQADRFDEARAELDLIPREATLPALDGYRLKFLRGCALVRSGKHEAALLAFEQALDLANAMHDPARIVHVRIKMSKLFMFTGNLDLAATQIAQARRLAQESNDEAALVGVALAEADIADRRGDRGEDRRVSLEALAHAQRTQSEDMIAWAMTDLADTYMKEGNYSLSLEYSRRALPFAHRLHRGTREQIILFNMGIAEIGLGRLAAGKRRVEDTIQHILANGNPVDAQDMMREYIGALESAHDWRGAVDAYRRNSALRDQLLSTAREQALLELSAKFDDERRARQIELLKRDNAVKARDLEAQKLRNQLSAAAAVLIALVCGALGWSIGRVRKVNQRLRYGSEHDALTGLHNRHYFNEHILAGGNGRRLAGCVLLVDLDHFKRINDTFGHPAGDAVLSATARRLASTLREGDVLLRWGGEEFLILLEPMVDSQLHSTASRILDAVRSEPVAWNGERIPCTASIGCARFPISGAAVDVSLERAISLVDKALYHAKRAGRDRACVITFVSARSEQDLAYINDEFDAAAAARRLTLQMVSDTGKHLALAGCA